MQMICPREVTGHPISKQNAEYFNNTNTFFFFFKSIKFLIRFISLLVILALRLIYFSKLPMQLFGNLFKACFHLFISLFISTFFKLRKAILFFLCTFS